MKQLFDIPMGAVVKFVGSDALSPSVVVTDLPAMTSNTVTYAIEDSVEDPSLSPTSLPVLTIDGLSGIVTLVDEEDNEYEGEAMLGTGRPRRPTGKPA